MELVSFPYSIIPERPGFILIMIFQTFREGCYHIRRFLECLLHHRALQTRKVCAELGTDVRTEWATAPCIRRRGRGIKDVQSSLEVCKMKKI